MLRWALCFLVCSFITGLFGFAKFVTNSPSIAKIQLIFFYSLFYIGLILLLIRGEKPKVTHQLTKRPREGSSKVL